MDPQATHLIKSDKNDLVDAFHSIAKRHKNFKGKAELVDFESKPIKSIFIEARVELNHLQLAASTLAYLNHKEKRRQIWVVPAGHGKSHIQQAIT